jgi:hypothetical protein
MPTDTPRGQCVVQGDDPAFLIGEHHIERCAQAECVHCPTSRDQQDAIDRPSVIRPDAARPAAQ